MASGNILVPKSRSRSGHEESTWLSCQKNEDLQERVVHRRGIRSSGIAVIGEELEFQHERENAATFHVFKFRCSMVMTNFFIG